MTWSDSLVFKDISSTAIYLPVFYVPQAIAIFLAQFFDLSIFNSYRLARLFSLLICFGILLYANILYKIPPPAIIFLAMPMCIFQFSTIVPDVLCFATSALIGALSAKGLDKSKEFTLNNGAVLDN